MKKQIKGELQCLLCYKWFNHLGSHIAKMHKRTAKEYKMEFGLSLTHPLIFREIRRKKQEAYEDNREKYLANILGEGSKKYRFKKGKAHRAYFSQEDMERATKQINSINTRKEEPCPFCRLVTKHKESHIYNAHGYIKIKNYE